MTTPTVQGSRFIGLDVHKDYVVLGAVNAEQQVVVRPHRLSFAEFELWIQQHLLATDAVVLEATCNAWQLYDQLAPHAAAVTVANPLLVKWIASARVKTDPQDTLKLAHLLAAGLIPAVWVPPEAVRQLRALVAQRRRLIQQRTRLRNRVQALLQRHNLVPPTGDLFAAAQRPWWEQLALGPLEKILATQDLHMLDALEPLLAQVEQALCQQSVQDPWAAHVPYLLQLTGVGVLTAMTLLAAIGDITRFPHSAQLVSYAGLGVGVHDSGQTHHTGSITKQGRRDLRAALIEAAWVAVEHNPHWKAEYARLAKRVGPQKAIVAVARKLLVVVWHVWHDREVDRYQEATALARKLMTWAEQGGRAMRQGQTAVQFVRQQLDRLGVGQDLTELHYGSHVYKLPPSAAA